MSAAPPKSLAVQARLLASNVRRAVGMAWRVERRLTLTHAIGSTLSALLPVGIAYVGKLIVDAVVAAIASPAHEPGPALLWITVELALMLVSHASSQVSGLSAQLLRTRLALEVDQIIFEKALSLSVRHYEDPEFMDALERARKESSWRPLEMITHGLNLARNVVTLIGYGALLAQFSGWAVLALGLAGLPFLAETRFAAEAYAMHHARTPRERRAYYLGQLLTSDYYAKEVKLFALGRWILGAHRELYEGFYAEDRRFAWRRALAVTLLGGVSVGVFYAIYAFIVGQTVAGAITLGSMTLYLTVFRQGQVSFSSAMSSLARAYEDNLYMDNLFTLLAIESDDACERGPEDLDASEGAPRIRFDHVTFKYPGSERPCLDDVSFEVAPNETVALVGPNGAGKTTLVKLLVGLYESGEGQIFLDDTDIATIDKGELRARVGVVFQDFVHYHFSAADNVGIGWLPTRASRAEVERAASDAGAAEVIESLPEGYETMLGRWFGGEQLSIGQWQRMALARAFMRKSRVLVLDEPTASIDAEGEHEIFERFRELKRESTAILITHRFSTVRMADRIVVLDQGRVVEVGTHEALMQNDDGLYRRMFDLQAEGYRIGEAAAAEAE
ncbi:MAG: ABC transporter ATP-binding protein [Sandaracinaceae bacterium]